MSELIDAIETLKIMHSKWLEHIAEAAKSSDYTVEDIARFEGVTRGLGLAAELCEVIADRSIDELAKAKGEDV